MAKDKKKEFLDEFTEELIMKTVKDIKDRKKFEKDLERAKRNIEAEKLRARFEKYSEKTPEEEREKIEEKKEEKKVLPTMPLTPIPAAPAKKETVKEKPAPITPSAKPAPVKPKPELPVTNIPLPPKIPTAAPGEINFGKILPLIRDPAVTYIECPGTGKNIIIKRAGVTTKTQITLAKDEIMSIIKSFSEKARIPLIEGMLNARVSNLEISAVVTESGNPSFIIRKILVEVKPARPSMLQGPVLPKPGMPRPAFPRPMPPVTRPFTPGAPPMQAQANPPAEEKKGGFMSKKIKIG